MQTLKYNVGTGTKVRYQFGKELSKDSEIIFIGGAGTDDFLTLTVSLDKFSKDRIGRMKFVGFRARQKIVISVFGSKAKRIFPKLVTLENCDCDIVISIPHLPRKPRERLIETRVVGDTKQIRITNEYDIVKRVADWNEKRGLTKDTFVAEKELKYIFEEALEGLYGLKSEEARAFINGISLPIKTHNEENVKDAFVDIVIFALGSLYKMTGNFDDVTREIISVMNKIDFKPNEKDSTGKVIKDEAYMKFMEL